MQNKICLGTAQFGIEYGVANTSGKPDQQRAFRILDRAWTHGIRVLDTAALYGDSETLVGQWIHSRGAETDVRVVTKLPLLPELEDKALTAWIIRAGHERLETLGVCQLEGILLHRGSDLARPGVRDGLDKLQAEGVCRHIGVSAYHPEEAELGLHEGLDIFQVPYNILDRRFETSGWFRRARDKGVWIYARSPFLQGLLLLEDDLLPEHMDFARPVIGRWQKRLGDQGHSPLEAALRFSLGQEETDYTVLGVDSVDQMDQIIAGANADIPASWLIEVAKEIGDVEDRLILPYLWKI